MLYNPEIECPIKPDLLHYDFPKNGVRHFSKAVRGEYIYPDECVIYPKQYTYVIGIFPLEYIRDAFIKYYLLWGYGECEHGLTFYQSVQLRNEDISKHEYMKLVKRTLEAYTKG